jgi:hypothetical protein
LPLDIMLVASANPEDYTNRGRIITPLKDRFGSQIRTHYPLDADTEVEIMRQEARPASVGGITVKVPDYLERVVATFSQMARSSNQVNQRSGVSVRLSVSNVEVLGANAMQPKGGEHTPERLLSMLVNGRKQRQQLGSRGLDHRFDGRLHLQIGARGRCDGGDGGPWAALEARPCGTARASQAGIRMINQAGSVRQ